MNVKSYARIGAVAGIATLGLGLLTGPASADPANLNYTLAGVGSDTTQDVMNALAADIDSGSLIGSWDALGSAKITTRDGGAEINRPNGSSAGITALNNDIDSGAGNLDFARSSRGPADTVTSQDLTWIPYAQDAVSYAIRSGSGLPTNLTKAQLVSIYKCQTTSLNGISLTPLLPQAGSGTRSFFLGQLGLTEATGANPFGTCVDATVQEHNGEALDTAGDIAPYSVAQYYAQTTGAPGVVDRHGVTVLGSVDGVAPRNADSTLNSSFPFKRDVYNVVPTNKLTAANIARAFVGSGSQVCLDAFGEITTYGFGTASNCGDSTGLRGEN
ncbi:hypothetical protein [Streptomyces beijiangensis]|uniref:PBP domain-containing protein n=1 Tax=Streptomyces beijiangensis TaxID=163361 RepID=A0A939FCI3_9ACTN|nr:hypothetical protein [Streptomyces beijiangensis]MBO0516097.1 hypothetical protein [Streptomyces beijiangensis]